MTETTTPTPASLSDDEIAAISHAEDFPGDLVPRLLATLTARDETIAGLTRAAEKFETAAVFAVKRAETAESRITVLEKAINDALVYRGSRDPNGTFLAMACNCLSASLSPPTQVAT